MLWMASSVRLLPDACKPRRDAANASMLMSPRVSKIHPAVTLGLTFALSLSLQGPASAFEETDVLIPSDAYSVDSCFGGPESKQESVCSRAAILFDVAVEEHVPKSCPEFSGPRYIAAVQLERAHGLTLIRVITWRESCQNPYCYMQKVPCTYVNDR